MEIQLFKSYLTDIKTHSECVKFYENLFSQIIGQKVDPFFVTSFIDGVEFVNEEIYSVKHSGRILKITQKPEIVNSPFRYYFDTFNNIPFLSLSIVLTISNIALIKEITKDWLLNNITEESFIRKYS